MPAACASADRDARLQDADRRRPSTGKGPRTRQLRLEVAASQELHHHVRSPALVGVDVEHLHDVRRAEARARAGLALEALDGVGQRQHLVAQELDRDALPQAQVLGLEDQAHAAFAERPEQPVLAAHDVAGSGSPRGAFFRDD